MFRSKRTTRNLSTVSMVLKEGNTTNAVVWLVVTVSLVIVGVKDASADFSYGTPTSLGPIVNSSLEDAAPFLSADGLELYFVSNNRFGGHGQRDMWVTTRATISDPWDPPVNLGSTVNSSSEDGPVSISSDGLELYFSSSRSNGQGRDDLWVTRRATVFEPWGTPVNLGPTINSPYIDWSPSISSDGLELFMSSDRPSSYGGSELWVAARNTTDDDWGEPVNLGPTVNSRSLDATPSISSDGLMLFFQSNRPGGYGGGPVDIWVTMRTAKDADWGTPVNLGSTINTSGFDGTPHVSADGSMLYFATNRSGESGGIDIWQMSIEPVVDLNGDGIVNAVDMCVMVDYWGTDEPLCDIGPMPWGDSIVDVEDLKVLAEHLFEEPGLIAYWKLDETEGDIAYDSIGVSDGVLSGVPTWEPTAGMVGGALQFDGIDDVIIAGPPPRPGDGPCSVLAWVKGGGAGQAIISQPGGPDWLSLDPVTGHLMTELTNAGRGAAPLQSQAVIADGSWHRIGFVWDGLNRTLYVDGVAVAQDMQDSLANSGNGFYIGTGKNMAPGTYFSGLIDDVRTYNRAVRP